MTSGVPLDLRGLNFGRLTVSDKTERRMSPNKTVKIYWQCTCQCGVNLWVWGPSLVNGNTRSCGCLQREMTSQAKRTHGMRTSPEYQTWRGMLERTSNPRNNHYHIYGALGVTVCPRWMSFELFLEDMGTRPDGTTIDRFPDMSGDYKPGNCRWATPSEQSRNTSRTKFITWDGLTLCTKDWAERLGITGPALKWRIKTWGLDRAMTTPPSYFHQSMPKGLHE